MSTPENNATVEPVEQTLDDFAAELFGDNEASPAENANSEIEQEPVEAEDDASQEAEQSEEVEQTDDTEDDVEDSDLDDDDEGEVSEETEDDTLATEDDDEGEKPKKKNRFQERIDELTAARHEAERAREADRLEFQRKLQELESKLEGNNNTETPNAKPEGVKAPHHEDKNEDGSDKYPLGEYDPQYMKDTVQHMLNEQMAEQQKQIQQTQEQQKAQEAQAALQSEWNNKVVDAQERYPDFQTKGQQMLRVFEGIDASYGDYLTTTLMEMDNGTDVFYYLASNVEEAQKIVNSGARKATVALAKLDAQLGDGGRKGKSVKSKPKVSKAKTPPPANKGAAVAAPAITEDTDNLDDFAKVLFRKK